MKVLIDNIIRQLEDVQSGSLWMGESFEKKIGVISEEKVFIRPLPGLHSVAELIAHLTVWRQETILKVKTGKGSLTDDSEQNWRSNEALKTVGWQKIKTSYQNSLNELIELLKDKEDSFLAEEYFDNDFNGNYNYLFVIEGMLLDFGQNGAEKKEAE